MSTNQLARDLATLLIIQQEKELETKISTLDCDPDLCRKIVNVVNEATRVWNDFNLTILALFITMKFTEAEIAGMISELKYNDPIATRKRIFGLFDSRTAIFE